MTQPPLDPRPESAPANDDKPRIPKGNRLAVVAICLAVIVLLASGVAVLIATIGNGSGRHEWRQESSSHQPAGGSNGSGPGAWPTASTEATTPSPMPHKVIELADHPLLQDTESGLPNLACELPAWDNSEEAAKEFFRAATQCLDKAWAPVLRANDLPFTPPRLYFPTGSAFSSDCGTIKVGIETAAYYCEGELFLPWGGLQVDQYQDNPGVYLALIAHEYGHHVQEVVGIMDAAWRKIYQAGEHSDAGKEMSRRKELQAQCFSGMFMGAHVDRGGSITREMYDKAWHDQETRGDDTSGGHDHGSNANYAHWWRVGALDNRLSDCNTFKASKDAVR